MLVIGLHKPDYLEGHARKVYEIGKSNTEPAKALHRGSGVEWCATDSRKPISSGTIGQPCMTTTLSAMQSTRCSTPGGFDLTKHREMVLGERRSATTSTRRFGSENEAFKMQKVQKPNRWLFHSSLPKVQKVRKPTPSQWLFAPSTPSVLHSDCTNWTI